MTGGMLTRLEVDNFKSYQGKHVIGPFADFTAVIGPNGAGKSNVMDAISFVLGVQASSLRGTRLSDLIYRPEGEQLSDQTRNAMVTLVYADKDKEMKLSRTINPKGSSDYKLNGKTVTYDEFDKKLKSYGILVKARNFLVFQGDVEAMAQKKGKELADMFEIISGSEELRSSYEELKELKREKDEALIHASSKTKSLRAEKKVVKEQKREAEQFDELVARESQLKSNHLRWQLFQVECDIRENVAKCEQAQEEVDTASEALQEKEDALKEKTQERAKHNREEKQQQKKMDDLRKTLQKLNPQRIELEEKIVHAEKKNKASSDQLKKLNKTVDIHTKTVQRFTSELTELEEAAAEFEKECAEKDKKGGLNLGASQKERYEKIKHQAGVKTAKLRGELKELERSKSQAAKDHDVLDAEMQSLIEQKKQIEAGNQALSEKQDELEQKIQGEQADLKAKEAALASFREQKDEIRKKEQRLQEKIHKSEQVLQDARADKRESSNEKRQRESLDALQRLFPGVKGRVIDLCQIVDRKYNLAVTVTMGRDMDSIVVDTKETAMQCIDYLKSQHMGRMTFIPLDVDAKPINDTLRRQCTDAKNRCLAIDVIRFDSSLDGVLRYACGNTVICPDVHDARKLCFGGCQRVKAVTLAGVVIAKNGNMTGGQSDNEARASRWEQKEVEALKQKRDKWRSELQEIQQGAAVHEKEAAMQSDIAHLKSQIKRYQTDQTLNEEKVKKNRTNIDSSSKEIKKLKPKHSDSQQKLDALKEKVVAVEQEIGTIEEGLFSDFSAEVGVSNIREYEETILTQAKQQSEKRLKFRKNIEKLKSQLELEKSRDRSEEKQKLLDRIKSDQAALEKHQASLDKCSKEMESVEKQMEDVKNQAGEQDEETKELDRTIKALRKAVDEHRGQVTSTKKKVAAEETRTEQLRSKRLAAFQQSRVDEVEVPLTSPGSSGRTEGSAKRRRKEDGGSGSSRDFQASEAFNVEGEQDGDQRAGKMMCIDFSDMEDSLRNHVSAAKYDELCNMHHEELKGIALELERLSPNLRAMEKFTEVEGRLKTLHDEHEIAKKAAEDAAQNYDAVRKKRHTLFMKAFEHVSSCIDGIYKDLTRTAQNPQGGTAVLTLENDDEPYLHGVRYYPQPPYKGFRDIEQLSGGEKSIAALAFLFAIHSFHPSPFFVLDEVDAALDTGNVRQVAQYVKSRKNDFQSIVISLKDQFYENADVLIGIARDRPKQSSAVYTLDLCEYDN